MKNMSSNPFQTSEKQADDLSRSSSTTRRDSGATNDTKSLDTLPSGSDDSVEAEHASVDPTWPRGWRPYVCLFGGFLLMFNSWGLVNTFGTYSSYYLQTLLPGTSILLLNLVGSTQSFMVLSLSAVIGRFLDAGYSRHLLICGTILVGTGSFTLSVVNGDGGYGAGNYGLIWLTQGFISGLGMACFFVSSSQVVATWFKKRKSFAIGVVASGASIAGLIYPMMNRFLTSSVGFNNATRCIAAVITATSALAVVAANPNPAHQFRRPEKWLRLSVFVDTHAFRNRAFAWLVAAICALFFGFYAVFFNLEEWAVSSGFGYRVLNAVGVDSGLPTAPPTSAIHTFWLLSIMNASSTLGRLGSAYLSDHYGALNVHAVVMTIASVLILVLWTLADSLAAAIAFVVTFGIFSGAVIGLPPASVAYILGPTLKAQTKLGQWTGMMYSCSAIFALTGPVIAGYLITTYNTFITVQCWSGACLFVSALCMMMAIWEKQKAKRHHLQAAAIGKESV